MKTVILALNAERKAAVAHLAKIDKLIAQVSGKDAPKSAKAKKPMSQETKDKIAAANRTRFAKTAPAASKPSVAPKPVAPAKPAVDTANAPKS